MNIYDFYCCHTILQIQKNTGQNVEHSTPYQVGMTRLELATSRPPDACANQLRYIPCFCKAVQR